MKIDSVIFDFGNVLSMPNTYNFLPKMEKLTGIDGKIFLGAMGDIRKEFDLGNINACQLYQKLLSDAGYTEHAQNIDLCKTLGDIDLESWNNPNIAVNDWALSLQKQGFKLGILSNMPYEFLQKYRQNIPAFCHANYALFSCDVHIIKPCEEIYKMILQKLNTKPQNAVFFDDLQANIDAAKQLGINAILWQNLPQAQIAFEEILKA